MKASVKWKLARSEAKRYSQTKYREVDTLWTGREHVGDTMDITFRSFNKNDQYEHFELCFDRSDENELRRILRTIQDYLEKQGVQVMRRDIEPDYETSHLAYWDSSKEIHLHCTTHAVLVGRAKSLEHAKRFMDRAENHIDNLYKFHNALKPW